jgi:hypothetical protein
MQDFRKHLTRQLAFLERSCAAFDAGFSDEAIRIAQVLRIMFHDTASQMSLLRRLGAQSTKLLDTAVPPTPITKGTMSFDGMGAFLLSGDGTCRYFPSLGDSPVTRLVPFPDWWSQEVFIRAPDLRLTRKSIVLAAADKDGGAHVDASLTPEYAALAADGVAGCFVVRSAEKQTVTPIVGAHFVCLRQMGFEVANSPDLAAHGIAHAK